MLIGTVLWHAKSSVLKSYRSWSTDNWLLLYTEGPCSDRSLNQKLILTFLNISVLVFYGNYYNWYLKRCRLSPSFHCKVGIDIIEVLPNQETSRTLSRREVRSYISKAITKLTIYFFAFRFLRCTNERKEFLQPKSMLNKLYFHFMDAVKDNIVHNANC